jgi:two-component sensor histidine kinase/CHASE3 domain sensor protein
MPISKRYLVTSTLILLLVGAAALLCLVGATVWLSQRAQSDTTLVDHQRAQRSRAVAVREALLAAESSQRGYILSGNEIYLAPYENAKLVALSELAQLTGDLAPSGRFGAMLPRLKALIDQRLNDLDTAIEVKIAGYAGEAAGVLAGNQGKALMDEVQVFLSAIVLEAEDALTVSLRTQTTNILALQIGTILASILILGVVVGVVVTFVRYTREIAQARDALSQANTSLEMRVAERTEDLVRARDRAEVLLTEVNHRVANNLSFVGALIRLQRQSIPDLAAKAALDETGARIQAVAEIHKHLYTSGDVTSVALDAYMTALLAQLEQTLTSEGHGASIRHDIEPVRIATNASISLGIVITEWVTNAFKYAYDGNTGEVRVLARKIDDRLLVAVEDDGTGMAAGTPSRGTGVGSKIVATIARSLQGEVAYISRNPGTEARIVMPLAAT